MTSLQKRIEKLQDRLELLESMTPTFETISLHALTFAEIEELEAILGREVTRGINLNEVAA